MTLLPTPFGEARVTPVEPTAPVRPGTALVLHGAGTDTSNALLLAVADGLAATGLPTLRLDQPYTLAPKRRPPAPAPQLDAVLAQVLDGAEGPFVLVGRSSGARVACRVAAGRRDVRLIVALGFPLVPPRSTRTRAPELAAAGVEVLVLQGKRDEFGTPDDVRALGLSHVTVVDIAGGHSIAPSGAVVKLVQAAVT